MKRCIVYDLHYGLEQYHCSDIIFISFVETASPFPVVKSVCRIECCSTESQQSNLEPRKKGLFSSNFRSRYSITAQTTTADLIPNYPLVVFLILCEGGSPFLLRSKHVKRICLMVFILDLDIV